MRRREDDGGVSTEYALLAAFIAVAAAASIGIFGHAVLDLFLTGGSVFDK